MSREFDANYLDTTEPYKSQLKQFRQTHRPKVILTEGSQWEYLIGGQGSEVVLMLHGGGGPAESLFRYVTALEGSYQVVAPTVPADVTTVAEVLRAISAILVEEAMPSVHLFGVSNGGMIGQCLVQQAPRKVRTLILFHSMLPSPEYAKQFGRRVKTLSLLPRWMTVTLGRYWLNKQLRGEAANAASGEQAFWIAYFNELYYSALVTKAYFVSRAKILTDYFRNYSFDPRDLDAWLGRTFIIESENDRVVNARERERLKLFYRQARVHTFRGAGHLGGGLFKVEETVNLIKDFLANGNARHEQHNEH